MTLERDASSPTTAYKPALRSASRARPRAAERRRENDPFDNYSRAREVLLTLTPRKGRRAPELCCDAP